MQDEYYAGSFEDNVSRSVIMAHGSPVIVVDGTPITPVPCYDGCGAFVPVAECAEGWSIIQGCQRCNAELSHE